MERFKNILVATDTRLDHHPIVEEAAEIAQHNGAKLKIVDVVPEFGWTVRLALKDGAHLGELFEREKREKLDVLAGPIREAGVVVETEVLHGKTSVEIIREVLTHGHDLVMRVAKASESRRAGYFGNTAIRLLRKCPCAVWLVSPNTTPRFKHVAGCVDTSTGDARDDELNDKIHELAASISLYHQGRFSVLHAWSLYGEQLFQGRMNPDEFEKLEVCNRNQVAELLDEFLRDHASSVSASNVHLLKGEPAEMIPQFTREQGVDLVVMGTVARSGLSGLLMGNTAEKILNRLECSVLAVKPTAFVCPIREREVGTP
jgi:nucleotide-binding universal stress UspA family protein